MPSADPIRPPVRRRGRRPRIAPGLMLLLAAASLTCSSRDPAAFAAVSADQAPSDARTLHRQALDLEERGRLTEALAACERAVELAPANPAAWRLLGYLRLNASDYTGSIAASENALDLDPSDAAAHANMSWAFAALGDKTRAEYHAARVDQLTPGSPDALALRAELEQRAGRAEAALQLYQTAAQSAPDNRVLQIRYAAALRGAGQVSRARDWLRAALERNPEALQLRIALADSLFELADFAGALSHAERVLAREPDAPSALYIAGAAAYQLREYSQAAARLGQYLKADEKASEARLLYANALLYLERWPEAENHYRLLLADPPVSREAQHNLGVTLLRSGRSVEAREIFSKLCAAGDTEACPYAASAPDSAPPAILTNPGN